MNAYLKYWRTQQPTMGLLEWWDKAKENIKRIVIRHVCGRTMPDSNKNRTYGLNLHICKEHTQISTWSARLNKTYWT
jgi:hypothetical protein